MKYKMYLWSLLSSIGLMLTQCDMPNGLASWEPDVLAPLATSVANAKDLTDVQDKVFEYNLPSTDLGFPPNQLLTIPPVTFPTIGPTTLNVSDFYETVTVKEAQFNIEIYNAFPIAISAGSKLVFRNQVDTTNSSNIIFQHVIQEDIQPDAQYRFSTVIQDQVVNNKIYFYLDQMSTPGGEDVMFAPNGVEMRFEIGFLEIQSVTIQADQELDISQDVAISLVSESNGPDDDLATGDLDVFVSNELPLNIGVQVYFYGADGITIIDSLFDGYIDMEGGTTDDFTGVSITPAETEITILLDEEKMSNIKQSDRVRLDFGVNTNGYPSGIVTVSRDLNFEFQIVGDLTLKVAL